MLKLKKSLWTTKIFGIMYRSYNLLQPISKAKNNLEKSATTLEHVRLNVGKMENEIKNCRIYYNYGKD